MESGELGLLGVRAVLNAEEGLKKGLASVTAPHQTMEELRALDLLQKSNHVLLNLAPLVTQPYISSKIYANKLPLLSGFL